MDNETMNPRMNSTTLFAKYSIFLMFLSLVSCSKESSPTNTPKVFSLETSVTPSNAGTVTPSSGQYDQGETVEISAEPNLDHRFLEWQGDANGTENTISVTFNSDKSINAIFEEYPEPSMELPGYEASALPKLKIYVDVGYQIVDEPKNPAQMRIIEDGERTYAGQIGIEYRGSTSQGLFEKKSYGIETWDGFENDKDESLLGYPEEEDWVLHGPYSDKTLMRNAVIMRLSNAIGRYASRTKFVELELDGSYEGVYLFMENIKRDKNRVNITKLDEDENSPEEITGGYILKIDKTAGDNDAPGWAGDASYPEALGFRSVFSAFGDSLEYPAHGEKRPEETYILYEEPDWEDITDQQKEYVETYIYDFERALLNDDFSEIEGERAYEQYIDVPSFVDYFILNEFAKNADAFRISTYMHKDRGGKLKMGPIWDFNLSQGNDFGGYRQQPELWIHEYNQYIPNDTWLIPFWWERLMQDPKFRKAVRIRWQALRQSELSDSQLFGLIDEIQRYLTDDRAVERNFLRWDILGQEIWGNNFVGQTYEEDVDFMRQWYVQRLAWLDAEIATFE